jgi:signal transduction histidine kinase
MHRFLSNNREELIERCKAKVAQRPKRGATSEQLANGIPLFLQQLTSTLEAEAAGDLAEGQRISGATGGDAHALSEIGVSAAAHGKELLRLGYSVDQVVHDYGDLCQAITDLAVERDAPFSIDQFRTLNRCLDNAIADAMTEFSALRDASTTRRFQAEENERLGVLVHEMRNFLHVAVLGFTAIESGVVPVGGSTGALVKRSMVNMSDLLERSLGDVRSKAVDPEPTHVFSLAGFIADARHLAALGADARGCTFEVPEVDARIGITGNRDHLLAALTNLLMNAFKFTHAGTSVMLHAYADGDHVAIEVKDHCGGLLKGFAESMFKPFTQGGLDRSGLGLGLSIARRTVQAHGGSLTVRDVTGEGCVFTMRLQRHTL